jgi:hypothetical protein
MKPTHKLFAASAAVFIAAASQLVLTSNKTANAQANQTPLKQAIIVLRHADDLENNTYVRNNESLSNYWGGICPSWPKIANMASTQTVYANGNYQTETHGSVTTFQHGLTPYKGEEQAKRLNDELPAILEKWGMAPVKRVVTINPCPESSSPNPFDTVYPFLVGNKDFGKINKETEIKDGKVVPTAAACKSLLLLDNTEKQKTDHVSNDLWAILNGDGLLPTAAEGGGSTILCWEGHALLDGESSDRNILKKLAGSAIVKEGVCTEVRMDKGNVLYIFTKRENTGPNTSTEQKYNLYIVRALGTTADNANDLGTLYCTRIYEVNEVPNPSNEAEFPSITITKPKTPEDMVFSKY